MSPSPVHACGDSSLPAFSCPHSLITLLTNFQVGNEFSSVEALWSQFESVMGQQKEDAGVDADAEDDEQIEAEYEQPGGETGDEHGEDREESERGRGRRTRGEEKVVSGGDYDDGRGRSG